MKCFHLRLRQCYGRKVILKILFEMNCNRHTTNYSWGLHYERFQDNLTIIIRHCGRCHTRPSRIITNKYHKNKAFPLVKCIRRYVWYGPVIILVSLLWRKSNNFNEDMREKWFSHCIYIIIHQRWYSNYNISIHT